MKAIIIGFGSIGKRHADILNRFFPHVRLACLSQHAKKDEFPFLEVFTTWQEVDSYKPNVAFICNPTNLHVKTALQCAKRGMHLFIEKPLSHELTDLDQLALITKQARLCCYTAYCLRFHPVIKYLKERVQGKSICQVRGVCSSHLSQWRIDSRQNYSLFRDQGGGVILDLSHELDYLKFLFGELSVVSAEKGRVSNITIDAEDHANILLKAKEIPINLHLNFMSFLTQREIIIDTLNETYYGNLISGSVIIKSAKGEECCQLDYDRDQMMKDQTAYFFDHINNPQLMNSVDETIELMKLLVKLR